MKGSHYRTERLGLFTEAPRPTLRPYSRLLDTTDFPTEQLEELEVKLTRIAEAMTAAKATELAQLCPPSGYTYFGQFIDHDLSQDESTISDLRANPQAALNARSALLDLDQLYGLGLEFQPELYHSDGRFKIGRTTAVRNDFGDEWPASDNDLFRTPTDANDGPKWITALADKRADQNLMLAQMHVGLMKAHNRLLGGNAELHLAHFQQLATPFEQARRCLTWHYQWLIVNDFLPKWTSKEAVESVLNNQLYFKRHQFGQGDEFLLPIEINAAVFRIGHTLVRPEYHLRQNLGQVELLNLCTEFVGKPIPATHVFDWQLFFEQGAGRKQNFASPFDTRIVPPFKNLDQLGIARTAEPRPPILNLTARTLIRGSLLRLASGQQMAREFGTQVLTLELRATIAGNLLEEFGMLENTPLFYYLLAEAELLGVNEDGKPGARLGPLGARLLIGTLVGLLKADPKSYLGEARNGWQPTLLDTHKTHKLLGLLEYGQGS